MLHTIELVLGLLVAVAGLALLSHKLPIPYPILLVLGGLVLAVVPGLPVIRLNPELVFFLFLPPLLYPAALFTSWRDFHANLRPISLLAVGLVLFTTVTVGVLVHAFLPEFPLAAGFVLGAIISPPDAIAATAVIAKLSVPRRIVTVLEGESLVNDATALVAFRFAIAAVMTGTFSWSQTVLQFLLVVLGGVGVGLAIGFVTAWILKPIEDPPVEISLSILTPFAAYLLGERLGVSGVLAVVTAGLYHGWRLPEISSSRTRLQAGPVWEMIEFVFNGFVFLLIGLQLPEVLRNISNRPFGVLVACAAGISIAVILIRVIWVYPATYLPRLLSRKLHERDPMPPWQYVAIVAWTGIRGVVSLAAAMALPMTTSKGDPFPGRDLILFMAFVVIIVTLVVQGLSLPVLIRWLGVRDDGGTEREERQARLKANQAALARLDELKRTAGASSETLARLSIEYADRIRQLEVCEPSENGDRRGLFTSDYERFSQEALLVERRTIVELRNERAINDEVLRRIQRDIDLAEARLRAPERGH